MRLLVVDDDPELTDFLRQTLEAEGYTVDLARNYAEGALLARSHSYAALILDVGLPDGSGFELVEQLREEEMAVPVLMLTARGSKEDVIRGLNAGADDYLAKPFVLGELVARVRALVRRSATTGPQRVTVGDLVLDRLGHVILRDGKKLRFTPKEYALLEYFMLRPEQPVARDELLREVWNIHFDPGSNVVDTHVARLRSKLERYQVRTRLLTVRGAGFQLTPPASSVS